MVLGIFKIALRLRDRYGTITGNFEANFLKKANSFAFPYKTAFSEANVKTNRMGSIKWTYYKERIFSSNYFI